MSQLRFLDILPAQSPVQPDKGLNLLLLVDNPGGEITTTVRFYGSDGGTVRQIHAESYTFQAESHVHAYFHLPPACFSARFWGEKPEELELWAGLVPPVPGKPGLLLFMQP